MSKKPPTPALSSALARAALSLKQAGAAPAHEARRFDAADALLGEQRPRSEETERITVPLALCARHPQNARRFYPPEELAAFSASLARDGQLETAKGIPDPEKPGHWLIVDGARRLMALKLANAPSIDVTPLPDGLSPLQIYRISRSLNVERAEQTDLDNAFAWSDLVQRGIVADGQALADEIGVSKSTTSRMLALASISGELLEVMKSAPARFPYRLANELRLLADEKGMDKAVEIAQVAVSADGERITVRYVEALRRATDDAARHRSRENPHITTALQVGDRKVGAIKLFPSGRIQMELSGITADVQELLHDKVRQILQEKAGA